jgi:hypothetical protein
MRSIVSNRRKCVGDITGTTTTAIGAGTAVIGVGTTATGAGAIAIGVGVTTIGTIATTGDRPYANRGGTPHQLRSASRERGFCLPAVGRMSIVVVTAGLSSHGCPV